MKIRLSFLSLLLGLALGPALVAQPGAKGPPTAGEDEPETELGRKMEKMNGAFRKLRRQAGDATKNQDSLAQLAIVREMSNESLKLEPVKKTDIPAAEQAKFVASYQEKMKEFIVELDKLEAALKAGKNDEAVKYADSLAALQKADHKEFKKQAAKK